MAPSRRRSQCRPGTEASGLQSTQFAFRSIPQYGPAFQPAPAFCTIASASPAPQVRSASCSRQFRIRAAQNDAGLDAPGPSVGTGNCVKAQGNPCGNSPAGCMEPDSFFGKRWDPQCPDPRCCPARQCRQRTSVSRRLPGLTAYPLTAVFWKGAACSAVPRGAPAQMRPAGWRHAMLHDCRGMSATDAATGRCIFTHWPVML